MNNKQNERAVDSVGRPNFHNGKTFGKVGGETGSSKKSSPGESTKGIGGNLSADNMKEEPIIHEAAYRGNMGGDRNESKKAESGLPRQEAAYQNRDRQGSGLEAEPVYQRKIPSYPKSNRPTKQSSKQDD